MTVLRSRPNQGSFLSSSSHFVFFFCHHHRFYVTFLSSWLLKKDLAFRGDNEREGYYWCMYLCTVMTVKCCDDYRLIFLLLTLTHCFYHPWCCWVLVLWRMSSLCWMSFFQMYRQPLTRSVYKITCYTFSFYCFVCLLKEIYIFRCHIQLWGWHCI